MRMWLRARVVAVAAGVCCAAIGLVAGVPGLAAASAAAVAGARAVYVPLGPVRVMDTRTGLGVPKGPLGPGKTISLKVEGAAGVPASGVTAVVLNVTATSATATSSVTVYADGKTRPKTPNLDFTSGQTIPNLVVVPVGADGKVDFYNAAGSVELAASLSGYYTAGGAAWGDALQVPGLAALNSGGSASVLSVSCRSTGNCSTGGYYKDSSGHFQAFVADEVNGTWGDAIEVPGTAALNTGGEATVISVSCASAGNCAAGGHYTVSDGKFQAFVAGEVNGTWGNAIEVPGTGNAAVAPVSCASAGNCAAGGSYTGSNGGYQAFVANEVNGTWDDAIEVPGTAALNTGGNAAVSSLSCASAGNCAAGGFYTVSQAKFEAFVATEVNGTWGNAIEVPGTAALNAGGDAAVDSVSCPSAGNCAASGDVAVGSASGISGQVFVVSEVNGTWAKAVQVPGQAPPNDRFTNQDSSVSCLSAGNCVAAGSRAFAVSEVNGTWGEAVQVPGSGADDFVNSVTCPPGGRCTAGGATIVASQK